MSSSEADLEEQLKEAGNKLLDPPSSIDELFNLLDKVESLLANVEQAPSESMKDALLPSMRALITNKLLRHAEMDVKISVTSCITEITRITAPDAPYDDQQMKEIFQLTVAAFEKLSHVSSRCYTKAVSILDTVAKIRSCLVMLDLECDALVVQMFENFLKIIRSNHPHTVFSAMETIMTLVIDESEEISLDLLSPLLASVKKENLNVSPISWKLGEKVINNCAVKLKDYLKEAVESMSLALDDYSQTVATICQSEPNPFKQEHPNDQAKENKLGKMTDPNELTRTDLNDSVQLNQGPIPNTFCPTEVGQSVDGTLKSVMSNCTNDDTYKSENSSKRLHRSHVTKHSKGIGASNGEPGKVDTLRAVKPDEPASVPKKRGRKPNSLMNPEEGYDHSWISTGRKAPNMRERKLHDKGFDDSASGNLDPEKATLLTLGKATEHSDSQSKSNLITADFPCPDGSLPDASRAKRGRPKKKENLVTHPNSLPRSKRDSLKAQAEEKASQSADLFLKKESEVICNSDAKPLGRPRRIRIATKTNEETTVAPGVVSDKEAPVASLPEEKPMRPSTMNAGMVKMNDRLLLETSAKKRKREHATSEKDDTEASGYEMLSKSGTKSNNKDESYLQETPKTKARRKRTTADEGSSVNPDLGEQLVGSRIKVWWPLDKMFYEGVVNFYDPIKKKHQVLYADGDEEILNLRKERWELVGENILPEDQETDLPEPDASSDITQKRKRKTTSESAKQEKGNAASKRGGGSRSISKVGRTKSGGSSADDPKHDQAVVYESQGPPSLTNDGSKDDGGRKSTGKLSIGRPKTGSSFKQSMPKTTALPKGFL